MCLNKECGPNACPDDCMNQGTVACDDQGKCGGGLKCDPKQGLCVPCSGTCGSCDSDEICSSDYICVPKTTDPCLNKECGSDGKGGTCGTCDEGKDCDDGICVTAQVDQGPETVGDIADEIDTASAKEDAISQVCPAGMHWYYNKCVKDTEPEPEDNKESSSCALGGSNNSASAGLLLLLALALAAHRIARRRS
jgi:hypothetical protein